MYSVANNVQGLVQNNPFAIGETNLIVDTDTDTKLNTLGIYPLFLTLWDVGTQPNDTGNHIEIVEVTARVSPQNYTVVRGQQGTSDVQHEFGDNVALFWTKGNADNKQNQDGSTVYAVDTGSADAYAVALSPAIVAYSNGLSVVFKAAHANTTTSTLAVNGLSTITIKKGGSSLSDLIANDIIVDQIVEVVYDGTYFQMVSPPGSVFAAVPPGFVNMYAGPSAPLGWLFCNGSSLLQATYPALFAAIGTTFGSADGSHFNVPDLRGRVPIGVGTGTGGGASGTGLPTGGSALTARALAAWLGEETHQLTTGELAAHTHNLLGGGNSGAGYISQGVTTAGTNVNLVTASAGSNTAHNTMQPTMTLNFIIKT
jgi:microcystin-dependent protein